jgi:hypothetical protein
MRATDKQMRDWYVRDLAENARQRGRLPNVRAFEDIAAADLERTDAMVLARRPMTARKKQAQRMTRELVAEGKTLTRRPVPVGNPDPQMQAPCSCGMCTKCRLRQRLWALLQSDDKGQPLYPGPRADIISEWFDCRAMRKDYRPLKPADRARLFDRRLADIADRSRAIIGLTREWSQHG